MSEKELVKKVEELQKTLKATPGPVEIPLAEVDMLKLQNIVLREQNETMRRQMVDKEMTFVKETFYEQIINKYNIDTSNNHIELNPQTNKIVITPV